MNNGLLHQPSRIRNAVLSLVLVVATGALYYPVHWPLQRMFNPGEGHSSGMAASATAVPARRLSWLRWEKLPLFALSAADSAMTVHAQGASGGLNPLVSYTLSARLQNALVSYVRYMGKAFWPSRLTVLYPYSPSSIRGVACIGIFVLVAAGLRTCHDPQAAIEQYQKVITLSENTGAHYVRIRLMAFESMADAYRDLGDNAHAAECIESATRMLTRGKSR